jgi:predicted small metal-binding protein
MSYLQQLLKDQMLSPAEVSALEAHREEVENYLRKEFGAEPVIRYGGSKAKNTMVKECYDLDIICYFPGTNQDSLAEIRKKVFTHLDKEYKLKDKTTAIRILDLKHPVHPAEYHIDVVPGCFVDGKSGDANLPLTKGDKKCLKTNIDKHVEAVSKSDCREIIKLGKIWAKRHGIDFRTFVMENFIIDKLAGFQGKDNLEKSFAYVLNALSNDFLGAKIVEHISKAFFKIVLTLKTCELVDDEILHYKCAKINSVSLCPDFSKLNNLSAVTLGNSFNVLINVSLETLLITFSEWKICVARFAIHKTARHHINVIFSWVNWMF